MHDTADNMALESRFDDIERELIEVWSSLPAVTSGSTKSEEPAGTLKRTELSKDAIEEMSKRSIENMQELAEKQKLLEQLESAINKFDDLDDGDVVQPDDGGKAVSSSDEPSKGEALRDGNESSPSHRRTRSTASESDQWHAAAHSRVYVAPVKPRERKNSALPPMILQRMDEEYQSLVGSPMPPPRKDVLPPTAETFAESTKVPKTFQSITVKTFHLPAKRTTDNSPKPSGSLVNSPRSDVSRGKPDEPKTEVPKPPKVAKPEEAETPAEAADVISGLPKLAIPPRRKIPTTHVQEIPVSAFGARRTPPSRTASLLLSASPIAMSAEGTKSPQFSSPQSSSSSQSNSPHSNPPHSASQIPAQLQVQNPIPPARRSSMAPSIRIENSDVHASQVVAGPRFGTAFNFPPPPNRPPPSRLSVMGVLNPEPRPTARPSTLGRQFGDPTNITSFVTPYHNHPSKSEVAIESVGAPMLVTSSFRGRMIPLQDVWEDLDQRGFEPLRNGHGEKESKSGWGTLNRMINKAKAMRPGPGNNSPTTSEDANGVPLSPSQRTSTVYPSPPSSPRRPGKREAPGKFGSLGRAMGNVMRTFDVSSKSPTIASLIGQSADSMGPYMHNGRLETASLPRYRPPVFSPPDANIRRLSQIETPVGVVMDAEHERKLSSEMVEFRKHLLNTYASGPQHFPSPEMIYQTAINKMTKNMLIDELNTSDFFSDDTRADGLSSPPRPSSDSLEQAEGELPAFSPTSARIRELLGEDLDGFEDDGEREEDVIDGADDLLAEREETPSPEGSSSPPAETEHTESKDGPGEAGQPQSQPKEGDPARREKQEWVKKMRLQFCVRKDFEVTKTIIHRDGTLNQEYFRPPRGTKLMGEEVKKWTESDRALLVKGIEKYGIGHFREISEALLPAWQPNDLRVKSMRLMGRQNLQEYRGWRGTEEDIKAEFARNNEIGVRLGCWKSGVLVFDDDGLVDAEVKANPVKVPIVEAEDESLEKVAKRPRRA